MRSLLLLGLAIAASVALYLVTFSIVHRPLTIGDIPRLLDAKTDYGRSLPSPKVVVFAGSNGRFSHRCEPISNRTGLACVNLSIAVGIGLDFLLERLDLLVQPGDIVYLPLEYSQYRVSADEMAAGAQNPVLVQAYPEHLRMLEPARQLRAWGSFDLPFLMHGVIEMALESVGFRRLATVSAVTPQGDAFGHTAQQGEAYREFRAAARPDVEGIPEHSHAITVLTRWLTAARDRGIHAVGGLPTIPDDVATDPDRESRAREIFLRSGQAFITLQGQSRYPRDCFFDTLYHLNEQCQWRHSDLVGAELARLRLDGTIR